MRESIRVLEERTDEVHRSMSRAKFFRKSQLKASRSVPADTAQTKHSRKGQVEARAG